MGRELHYVALQRAAATRVACRSAVTAQPASIDVDRERGIIRGLSVITAGVARPANAPPFMVDQLTLQSVADAINRAAAEGRPVRVRVTHPELTPARDGIEWTVGTIQDAVVEADRTRADVHLGSYAAHTPAGNLRAFLLGLAAEHPTNAGLSIIIDRATLEPMQAGPPAARVEALFSVDFVGEPGANAAGMLSGGGTFPRAGATTAGATPGGWIMDYNEQQIEYLRSLGLPQDADAAAVAAFVEGLTDEQRAVLAGLATAAGAGGGAGGAGAGGGSTPASTDPPPAATSAPASGRTATSAPAGAVSTEYLRELHQIGAMSGLGQEWAMRHAMAGTALAAARAEAVQLRTQQPLGMGATAGTRVHVGHDRNLATIRDAVRDAIMLRAGNRVERPHPRAAEFRHLRLVDIGRAYLCACGLPAQTWAPNKVARVALNSRQTEMEVRRVALTAGDYSSFLGSFASVLADTAGKALQMAYQAAPVLWRKFCTQGRALDFRQQDLVQLGAVGAMTATTPGDLVAYASLTDGKEQYSLTTYTSGAALTIQQMVNDDVGAFGRLPQAFGVAAKQKEDALAFSVLSANAAMADSVALFHASHGNLAGTGGAMSVTTLQAGIAAMKAQTALGGSDPLDIVPGVLIVPATLAALAKQLVYGAVDPGSSGAASNPHQDQFVVVDSARLSGTAWYLAARPGELVETIQVAFLDGAEEPEVTTEEDFDSNVLKYKVVHHVAAKAADYRGLYKNPGA